MHYAIQRQKSKPIPGMSLVAKVLAPLCRSQWMFLVLLFTNVRSADGVNVGRLLAVHFLMWTWSQVRKLWICGKTCLWNMLQDSLTTYVTLFLLWMSLILWRHVTFLCLITYCHNLLLLLLIQPLLFLCLTIFIFSFFRTWSWLSQVCKSKIPGLFIYLVSVDATIIIFQPVDCIVISFVTSRQTTIELR